VSATRDKGSHRGESSDTSLSGKELHTVTVATRAFPYRIEEEHPYEIDGIMLQDRTAMRGDTIKVLPADFARGMRLNAFLKEGQTVEGLTSGTTPNTELQFSAADATDTELINWIKDDGPKVQEVVDASEGDAEVAARLLAAETQATGNDPRKGVVAGLEAVISRATE
jgi:hypothetical protein